MLVSLVFLLSAQSPVSAPVFPAGCSPAFERAATLVEQSLQDGDFSAAARRLQLLPKLSPGFSWDDHKVPAEERQAFAEARDDAFRVWDKVIHDASFARVGKQPMEFSPSASGAPDLKFSFEPELAVVPNDNVPGGVVTFASETVLPRIEAVIGLKRGADRRPINVNDVQNSVQFAVGAYLGIAESPMVVSVMGPHDAPSLKINRFSNLDVQTALKNLEIVETLRQAVHAKTRMVPSQPISFVDPVELTHDPVLQGTVADVPLQLSNSGTGVLTYSLVPECGCINPGPGGSLNPGESRLIQIAVDSKEYVSAIKKHVFLVTNDPDNSVRSIPVTVPVMPRYRWIVPGGDVQVVDPTSKEFVAYLTVPDKYPLDVRSVRFDGIPGKVTIKPWKGVLADPEFGEPAKARSGYELRVRLSGYLLPGRSGGTISVSTLDPDFAEIFYTLYFQKGIIAMPDDVNLGLINGAPKTANIQVTRPGKPFRVVGVKCLTPNLKATFGKIPSSDDYRISLTTAGKVQSGDFIGTVLVYTDDPAQPKIEIAVHGIGG
jgi:hypothetical protein